MQAYHFFSPLLAPDQAWAAFGWQAHPAGTADMSVLASVVDACVTLAREHPVVVPCSPEWLHDKKLREFIGKLGRDRTILDFSPGAFLVKEHEAACKALRQEGVHVAAEIADGSLIKLLNVASADYLCLEIEHARNGDGVSLLDLINAHQSGFQLISTGVRSHELFDWAAAKRFSLMSGEFVATVDERAPVDADTTRLKLLRLLGLVVQDADTREIEEVFREEPKLSYNLLRLVNSVAVGPKTPITGFNHAITVLGRRQLQRWLQLLIYANQFGRGDQPNPLMQLAAARGCQLELMAKDLSIPDIPDVGEAAFMVGLFSLLDTLLHIPMTEVLPALPLAPSISAALGERSGILGDLLEAAVAGHNGDYPRAADCLRRSGVAPAKHLQAQADAYAWASRIRLE